MNTLYDWFAESAAQHRDRIALDLGVNRLRYGELDDLAGRVAAAVVRRLGQPPNRLGLLAARSAGAYAGYLAAYRLNATVVPLNPAYPPARTAAVATAAELDLVLADAGGSAGAVPVLPVDDSALAALPPANGVAAHWADAARPAYIMFTSGSTGTPKGVPVTHANVLAFLRAVAGRAELTSDARVSQMFDLTFDPSIFDLFATWGAGATVVVPQPADLLAAVRFVRQREITHWSSVPSVIAIARRLRQLGPDRMPTLRWSMFCGEPLSVDAAAAWQGAAPNSVIENMYGPTELTVTCTGYRLPASPADWPATTNGTVPIGEPYPAVAWLLLDEDLRPAAEGELCVRGPQRFPGYLDPADDSERFVTEASGSYRLRHGTPSGSDWYRTGDRVRHENGRLIHLGRLDHQVKVSGYRVELGEIEAVARRHPEVAQAVALALAVPTGGVELHLAYEGPVVDEEQLLAMLRATLAPFMVPRRLTRFEALPLTANGKIDRGLLGRVLRSVQLPGQGPGGASHQLPNGGGPVAGPDGGADLSVRASIVPSVGGMPT
ncbi:amino acid adenylation domain-containing protein [Micromonospora sp. MED01]|uniref:amino acid adenylation domain-containing protein n=1 Tax=Micromonospora alfalfae TaxID=2911212 RepID=UPI001EE8CF1B|nr:amino acid adenylation domain-containing protein [Micromonospora alfalfae]MCG5462819.1 amino acid adenylation domain-containing protein [Micromonospora alfalfae]